MPPLPVSDEKLEHHIVTTMSDVFVLLHMAGHYKTRAKTVYYKCAFILLASVVEALLYHYIECNVKADKTLVEKDDKTELKKLLSLDEKHTGSPKVLWLAEEVDIKGSLKSLTKDFNKMAEFSRHHLPIDNRLTTDLDYIRKKRNEIHLQGLEKKSRSWTKLQINKAGSTLVALLNALEPFNPT